MQHIDAVTQMAEVGTFVARRRRRQLQIEFPEWVKTTTCARFTRSALVKTPHGMVRYELRFFVRPSIEVVDILRTWGCPNPWHDTAPSRHRGLAICSECRPI